MEKLLIEFINTFDISLKKYQKLAGSQQSTANLTISQFQYIDAIHQLSEPTISAVAERLGFSKPSVTAGINKLVRLGFVNKTQSILDKRAWHVHLTESGERLVEAKYQALQAYGQALNAALSPEEARQFEALLQKIVRVIGQ